MSKTKKESKKVKGLPESLEEFFELAKKAGIKIYKNHTGIKYTEKAGSYSSKMSQAMNFDMVILSKIGVSKYGEGITEACNWYERFHKCELVLSRKIDDYKAERDLIEFPGDDAINLIKEMGQVYGSDKLTKEGKSLIKLWLGRVWYLINWDYALEQKREIVNALRDGSWQSYDSDGNLVTGVSDEDLDFLKTVLSIKETLIKILLRLPELCERSKELVDKIENLNICIWAILNHKIDELGYLAKCAEAAEEFKNVE